MKKIIYVVVLLISLCFMLTTYLNKNKFYDLKLESYKNDYVEKFAKTNNYQYKSLSDSEFLKLNKEYNLNIETFNYNNITNSEIEISGYNGISENLIIPEQINGKNVTSIKLLNEKVKSITISKNITNIDLENITDIEINCYKNNYCEELLNRNLNVNILNDSEIINFKNAVIDFEYNVDNNEIEITKLNGDYLIIPETINGMQITKVSLDILDMPTSIYLPTSVENISGITINNINESLYLSLFIQIITLCLVLSIMIISNKTNKFIYTVSIFIISFIYLLIMNFITYSMINNLVSLSIIITVIYIIVTLSILAVKNTLYEHDKKIKNIDEFKNQALVLANKSKNNEIIELIKYMDPVSTDKTKDIENEILEDLNKINLKSSEIEYKKIIEKIKERNDICKNSK